MNNIQKALLEQDIYAIWCGDEPTTLKEITKAYVTGEFNGHKRMLTADDKTIDIRKLKASFKKIIAK